MILNKYWRHKDLKWLQCWPEKLDQNFFLSWDLTDDLYYPAWYLLGLKNWLIDLDEESI